MKKAFWSRTPGKFVWKHNGEEMKDFLVFNGTIREWYETLVETLIYASNEMTTPASVVYAGRVAASILESSVLFRPHASTGALGSISNRFELRLDNTLDTDIRLVSADDESIVSILDMKVL